MGQFRYQLFFRRIGLDYVVLDGEGRVLFSTAQGLSESVSAATAHRDTMLDIRQGDKTVGKLIVYNRADAIYESRKRAIAVAVAFIMLLQAAAIGGYVTYLRKTLLQPFHRLKDFAQRVAGGNLDIPHSPVRYKPGRCPALASPPPAPLIPHLPPQCPGMEIHPPIRLLAYLAANQGRVVSKKELFEKVWEDKFTGDGTLNVHIRKIREAIEPKPNMPRYIVTFWGEGYQFKGEEG